MFPDTGPYSRDKYAKHVAFMNAGKEFNERMLLGGNRVGKTVTSSYEVTAHATGRYPKWWEGKVFHQPTKIWVAGDTSKTTRDIIQTELLGPPGDSAALGTGMLPENTILKTTTKLGLADAIETIFVQHVTGGVSTIQLKSFDQGREAFQGVSCHVIWLDEEPDQEIVTECLLRTMTTHGILLITCTPLLGLTDLMLSYLPDLQPAPEITLQ
jgi:phage terminase large subunit-like protein